ncbi:MAG: LUD domain-containing protein [Proteobacteria bacterium]|nr:LUD domain-containing protein [Pseudomonadota bacterium]MBU1585842.1 LUD domain-containing protein [Pseudomonadota bacterium]MBU2452623.1 LUD domain-containing protein [Pseudomonadota bacterium]MBU2630354.1 LUD domain-containing protein [Pseudomonadota bacterium]
MGSSGQRALKNLPFEDEIRQNAYRIRQSNIEQLEQLIELLTQTVKKNGGKVYLAKDGISANAYCLAIAKKNRVKSIVKGKSMLTEEIGLNQAFLKNGIDIFETDIGEFIIQLANDRPSHILAPAIHKTKEDIGKLFSETFNIPYTNDPFRLTCIARKILFQRFLTADMGISGCNLAIARTGQITLLSNEGNIRMATTIPPIHVAVMGMERLVASLDEHNTLMQLLPRAASSQKLPVYVSYISSPAKLEHADGPREFHLVIVDNHRSKIVSDPQFKEILYCLHCGACSNVCPVYRKVGGHAYGSVYPGPMGSVLTPLLNQGDTQRDLFFACTLCNACKEACPLHIDIPRMLRLLREQTVCKDTDWKAQPHQKMESACHKAVAFALTDRKRYQLLLGSLAACQSILTRINSSLPKLRLPISERIQKGQVRQFAKKTFIEQLANDPEKLEMNSKTELSCKKIRSVMNGVEKGCHPPLNQAREVKKPRSTHELIHRIENRTAGQQKALLNKFIKECRSLHQTVILEKDSTSAAVSISRLIQMKKPERSDIKMAVAWDVPIVRELHLETQLEQKNIPVIYAPLENRSSAKTALEKRHLFLKVSATASVGITSADYCLAKTGTLVLKTKPGQARIVSLLPLIHIAVIKPEHIILDMDELYALHQIPCHTRHNTFGDGMTLISGPSITGDIEAVPVLGAHGPREVYVFIILENDKHVFKKGGAGKDDKKQVPA